MKKVLVRFLSVVLALSLMPTIALAGPQDSFVKGDPDTFWGILYTPSNSDDTFVKSVNVTTPMLEADGAKALAKKIAAQLKAQPEGKRCIDLTNFTYCLSDNMQNYFFLSEDSKEYLRNNTDSFFKALKDEGAPLDVVIDDNESGIVCYAVENYAIQNFKGEGESIAQTIKTKGHLYEDWIKEQLIAIEKMPEYQKVRPLLEQNGFVFGEEYDLEYINIFPGAQEPRRTVFYSKERPEGAEIAYQIFNATMNEGIYFTAYREVVYDQIKKYYPDIKFSNYGDAVGTGMLDMVNYQGTPSKATGHKSTFITGTHTAPVRYGNFKDIVKNPPADYPWDTMPNTSFNQLLHAMRSTQNNTIASNNEIGFMVWVGIKGWSVPTGQGGYNNFNHTDYYQEAMFHFGLCNPDPWLIYNQDSSSTGDDLNLLKRIFAQLGELVGFEDRKVIIPTLNQVVTYDQRYVVSGMSANGKGIFRVTPDLYCPGVSMDNFLVSTMDGITFKIGNQYVKFPEGSYIYQPEDKVSEYGFWVITEEPVWPQEWRTADDPLPDMPIATDDFIPTGIDYESTETMPDPNNYEKKKVVEDDAPAGPVPSTPLAPSEDDKDDKPAVSKPAAITLKLNPITGKDVKPSLVAGGMPQDMVGHWAQHSMANMMGLGIMNGTGIGMEPDRLITKAEFLTMLTRILGVKTTGYKGGYTDVAEGDWYADVMGTTAGGGWIEDENGLLNPTVDLTRAKMCVILAKALGVTSNGATSDFADIYFLGADAKEAVNTMNSLGIIEGYPDGNFGPNNICTRAEAATIFERILLKIPELFGAEN